MRKKYIWDPDKQEMIDVTELEELARKKRIEAQVFIQDDTIPPTESMATGDREVFESKSALMRHYKEHGYECTGGDHLTGQSVPFYKSNKEEIKEQLMKYANDLKWGNVYVSEREREICKREEANYREYVKRMRG